jgi:hypothetical protein
MTMTRPARRHSRFTFRFIHLIVVIATLALGLA